MTREERLDEALKTMDFYKIAKITMEEQDENQGGLYSEQSRTSEVRQYVSNRRDDSSNK